MSIWFALPSPELLNGAINGSLAAKLGIRVTYVGDDFLVATMPVASNLNHRGHLHGGASLTLAQTLVTLGAESCVDPGKQSTSCLEINANHIQQVKDGSVTAMARPIHQDETFQVWRVEIRDDEDELVTEVRLTINNIQQSV